MKRLFLFLILSLTALTAISQPSITNVAYPSYVELFGLFEISFNMPPYTNPYDPDTISVWAVFTGPNNHCYTVQGFYYEGYCFHMDSIEKYEVAEPNTNPSAIGWRIRFTPDAVGIWDFQIHARDCVGETILPPTRPAEYSFVCQSVSNADGFISTANKMYLKRDIVRNGQRQYHSFFPIGPNVAWYSSVPHTGWKKVFGIYDYENYIDTLVGNGNYMRIWLNRYQFLSLYGPEYTETPPKMYFDTTLNQKDAAELDHIISYAAANGISLMLTIFSFGDFRDSNPQEPSDPSVWANNPFNSIIKTPCLFFKDETAKKKAKNIIRYVVARWGYATNIVSWELWNEVTNMPCEDFKTFEKDVLSWHEEVSDYIRGIDPYNHCISTSMSKYLTYSELFSNLFSYLDFVQRHNYQNINKAKSKEQVSYVLYNLSKDTHVDYPKKPFFMGEFGFGQGNKYDAKEPKGIDLHNSTWSSLFSTSMAPASSWWWQHFYNKKLFNRFKPILTFCQNLPILSDSFVAHTTGGVSGHMLLFPCNLETYYMINETEDTIYGWSQDTAFCYQSLRWLTDSVIPANQPNGLHFIDTVVFDTNGYVYKLTLDKRPHPSSILNGISIPINYKPVGSRYQIHWYNAETGLEYNNLVTYATVQQSLMGRKYIAFMFPSTIRDLNNNTITNTFGDAVFAIYFYSYSANDQKKKEKQ